jgi:hypothetical protein
MLGHSMFGHSMIGSLFGVGSYSVFGHSALGLSVLGLSVLGLSVLGHSMFGHSVFRLSAFSRWIPKGASTNSPATSCLCYKTSNLKNVLPENVSLMKPSPNIASITTKRPPHKTTHSRNVLPTKCPQLQNVHSALTHKNIRFFLQ